MPLQCVSYQQSMLFDALLSQDPRLDGSWTVTDCPGERQLDRESILDSVTV
jgi:hypothetical protein